MTTENMIKLLSANTDLRTMLNTSNTTATKRALKGMTEEELVGLCEQFGINLEETPTEGAAVLSAVEGINIHVTPKGDNVAYVLVAIEKATKESNVVANFNGKQILINNKDLGLLVKKGVLKGTLPVKADTITPIPTLPGWYNGQVLAALIPELMQMIEWRNEQASELAMLRKALRTAKLPQEEIRKRVGDRMEADIPRSKCPF